MASCCNVTFIQYTWVNKAEREQYQYQFIGFFESNAIHYEASLE